MPRYEYDLQDSEGTTKAGGAAPSAEILAAFDRYDWSSEITRANEVQHYSPTLLIRDPDTGREIWVSACGDAQVFQFISYYAYPVRKKAWFGLVERDGFAAPQCRQDLSLAEAREALRLFLEADHDALVRHVSSD